MHTRLTRLSSTSSSLPPPPTLTLFTPLSQIMVQVVNLTEAIFVSA